VTLDDARAHVGARVVYAPIAGRPEIGIIVRVSDLLVFVDYGGAGVMGTYASDLTLLWGDQLAATEKDHD